MAGIFTTGRRKPNAGKDGAFVGAWAGFAAWASDRPGAGSLRLARDLRNAGLFLSFEAWESIDAVHAWKGAPDFHGRLARVLQHVDEFESTKPAVVATAEAAATSVGSPRPPDVEPAHAV